MAYKFQDGTAVLKGQVTSSIGFSGSAISADYFYGSGDNLTGITADPGGSTTQIQYNNGGSLAGDAAMVFNNSTDAVTFTGALTAGSLTDGTATINGSGAGSGFTTFGVTHLSASTGMSGSQVQGSHLTLASGHVVVSTAGLVEGIQFSGSTGLSGSQLQGGHLSLGDGRVVISNAGAAEFASSCEAASFTDDTFTISSGAGSGFTTFGVTQLSASTGMSGSQVQGSHLTLASGHVTVDTAGLVEGIQFSGSTGLSGSQIQGGHLTLASGHVTVSTAGAIEGASLSDGTATITAGAASGLTTVAMGGALTGVTTLDASGLASLDGGINTNDVFTVSAAGLVVGTQLSASVSLSGSEVQGGYLNIGDNRVKINNSCAATFASTVQVDGRFDIGNGVRYDSLAVKTEDYTLTGAESVIIASGSAAFTVTLPGAPTAGEYYVIKRHINCTKDITIASASADNGASIDGESTITLEDAAAVSLVYDGTTDTWSIF